MVSGEVCLSQQTANTSERIQSVIDCVKTTKQQSNFKEEGVSHVWRIRIIKNER